MKTLAQIGEFGLINRIDQKFCTDKNSGNIGIGDDCAVIQETENTAKLITTDLLIENIHFIKNKVTPKELGYKSLAVNLSDIAAMGGTPEYVFISVGFPAGTTVEWVENLYSGINNLAQQYNVRIMGGDTTRSPENITINIMIVGHINKENIKYRSSAKMGDIICLTGPVGDSRAGLKVLKNDYEQDELNRKLIKKHYTPPVNISEGKFLAGFKEVHAMIDVSDGIDSDISHIMEESGLGASINLDHIPVSNEFEKFIDKYQHGKMELIFGGEDYELLFTIQSEFFETLKSYYEEQFEKQIYKIGEMKSKKSGLNFLENGEKIDMQKKGFDHFSSNRS